MVEMVVMLKGISLSRAVDTHEEPSATGNMTKEQR